MHQGVYLFNELFNLALSKHSNAYTADIPLLVRNLYSFKEMLKSLDQTIELEISGIKIKVIIKILD